MKKYLLLTTSLLFAVFSYGQVIVAGLDVNKLDSVKVVEVLIERGAIRRSVDVYLDFGQKDNSGYRTIGIKDDDLRILDPLTGRKMVFKSTAAVINFMEKNNWEHYDTVTMTGSSSWSAYYYFRRKLGK